LQQHGKLPRFKATGKAAGDREVAEERQSTAEEAEKEFIIDLNHKEYVSYILSRSNSRIYAVNYCEHYEDWSSSNVLDTGIG
jgi:hypothetical protein